MSVSSKLESPDIRVRPIVEFSPIPIVEGRL